MLTIISAAGLTLWSAEYISAEYINYKITPGEPNMVKFTSDAPLETIVGETKQIEGSLYADPENLDDSTKAEFEVQMESIDTGNGIRNGHMRDNHLHTDEHPISKFVLKEIKGLSERKLTPGQPEKFTAVGDFTLHGVTREVQPEITAVWNPDQKSIDITAKFEVLLQDYEIPRPKFLFMKLDELQKVEVNFAANAE